MIRYTRYDYRSGKDTLCYVTETPAVSVTVDCITPDKDRLDLPLQRVADHLFVLEMEFSRIGNYILTLRVDGAIVHVLNARVVT